MLNLIRSRLGILLPVTLAAFPAACSSADAQSPEASPSMSISQASLHFDFELRVHAILLYDDASHSNCTAANPCTTPADMANFVANANQVFAPASVHISFDPIADWSTLVDKDLNRNLDSGNGGANWDRANQIAATRPDQITVFLRDGSTSVAPGSNFAYPPNTGQAVPQDDPFPSPQPNFIAHDGDQGVAQLNALNFAHELGHFLGLYHTHLTWGGGYPVAPIDLKCVFGTLTPLQKKACNDEAAVTTLQKTRGANALDGDLVADTPQDPGPSYWADHGFGVCDPLRPSVTLNGVTYTPDRSNVMSYFGCFGAQGLTPGQIAMVRASLNHPSRKALNANFCGPAAICTGTGGAPNACGTVTGCFGPVNCGGCATGYTCKNNTCVKSGCCPGGCRAPAVCDASACACLVRS